VTETHETHYGAPFVGAMKEAAKRQPLF